MTARSPRTGNAELDRELKEILDTLDVSENRDLLFEVLVSAVRLAGDDASRLDLKITSATLKEMRSAFRAFAPYRDVPKVTIFGSARTLPTDPTYAQARDLAAHMAAQGWMVVTGAGPGIMAAGLEGAGREHAFGVNIRLPFEQAANAFIAGDEKLISMKYFFTRKLMLMKESLGFVSLPGGFGTLDETMELLTLVQTGKASPAPIVLLDEPGGTFWPAFANLLRDQVATRRLIDPDDLDLFVCTDEVQVAADEVLGFYRNYHSIRWVGEVLAIRVAHPPTEAQLDALREEFADLATDRVITVSGPLPEEERDRDHLELSRVVLRYNGFAAGRLHRFIVALNQL